MPWIKFVHIAALVCWCGALLYLPALLMASVRQRADGGFDHDAPPIPRFLFNSAATPAALLAIASGTLLFLIYGLAGGWLVLKLAAVMGMVLCHALCGWLILRVEQNHWRGVWTLSALTAALASLLMLTVIALVLAKPFA
ncbi:CopD family protein [Halomonas sp. ML-15]|uniref:CopD family protein n=1 Tax=Halomonas sp. ML-15 TaxID=2773305 RepID=UPI001747480A|nr:CopD family protein [Halomonas sp. ML-15]MBD3894801.1 CopD family protein [Halomonas sp. ML-15]